MSETVLPVFHQIASRGYEGVEVIDSTLLAPGHFPAKEINHRTKREGRRRGQLVKRGSIARERREGLLVYVTAMKQ